MTNLINEELTTYFTRKEVLEDIKSTLENGYDGYLCDLHNEVFNTDYYIIGTKNAEKALENYGVFKAIEKVMSYEMDNFGEHFTKIYEPEKLANMLYYIIGEEVLNEVLEENLETYMSVWDEEISEMNTIYLIDILNILISRC